MTLKNLIGTDPDQVSRNRDLGTLAYTDPNGVRINGGVVKNSTFNTIEYKDPYQNTDRVSISPTLNLNFVRNNQLDPRFTFTRASTATYTGKDGLIKTAAVNEPRFDYDPITHNCKGLLYEEGRTNYFLQSADFATSWTLALSTVSANQATSPDGSLTADKLIGNTTVGDHTISQIKNYTASSFYTMSVYAKPAGYNRLQLFFSSTRFASGRHAIFDVLTGTVVTAETGVTANIVDAGNGWYRCSITTQATTTGTGSSGSGIALATNTQTVPSQDFAGDGTSGIYLWGAQHEDGAFATSYMPTTTSTFVRSAEYLYMTDVSWLNITEGTSVINAVLPGNNASDALYTIHDGTGQNNYQYVYYYNTTANLRFDVQANNVTYCNITKTNTLNVKAAYAVKENDFAVSLNGDAVTTDTSGILPTSANKLSFGMSSVESNIASMWLKQFAYYPKRLSNATLQELSK